MSTDALLIKATDLGKVYNVGQSHWRDLRSMVSSLFQSKSSNYDPTKFVPVIEGEEKEAGTLSSIASRVVHFTKWRSTQPHSQEVWALKGFNFELFRGETVLLSGPNGAGKSTFLKILSKVILPSEGSVDLYGTVGSLLEAGAGLSPDLTGRENINFYGAICGVSHSRLQSLEQPVIDMAGINGWEDRSLRYYSSGMYARLAFSIVAKTEPDVLILDETLSVLDTNGRQLVVDELEARVKRGLSNVVVAH